MSSSSFWLYAATFWGLAGALAAQETPFPANTTRFDRLVEVKAKSRPDKPWTTHLTRPLEGIAGFTPGGKPVPTDTYGGRSDRTEKATGFFHAERLGNRWWLLDPEGHPFIHVGVASVTPLKSPGAEAAFKTRFGTDEVWGAKTAEWLTGLGFNGSGAWSDNKSLRASTHPLVYTCIWNFMSNFGKSKNLTRQLSGHAGYVNDCLPVFHPEFPTFCAEQARQLAATKDDPWLLGHFSDNELPQPKLEKFLELDPKDPHMGSCRQAAESWLSHRKAKPEVSKADVTENDREEFAQYVWEKYFEITTAAIRKADPNHLCLGSRLHGSDKSSRAAFTAAGKYLDVIAFNLYSQWTPDAQMLQQWLKWSGKPCLITEWYVKGQDSGMGNSTGAGWIVPTQADRGLFYQNFALGLLESRSCVGWNWFKYQDNDPANLKTDPSNRDSNKGLVNVKFEPYTALTERAQALNRELYPLIDHFDAH